MRNFVSKKSLVAVSANNQQTALATEQTLDTSMLVSNSSLPNLDAQRKTNIDEMTGYEEQDTVYDLGERTSFSMDFQLMQAQHMGFIAAFALGTVSTAAAGGTGYLHTITPQTDMVPALFTAAARYGGNVAKRRHADCVVDSFSLKFDRGNPFVSLSAQIKGSGKHDTDVVEETVSAEGSAITLDLTNAVLSNLAENVHQVLAETATGVWEETTCSAAASSQITITSMATAGTIDYKVIYRQSVAWGTMPARVSEPPLKLSECTVTVGGKWSGTALTGGFTIGDELNSFEWNCNNKIDVDEVAGGASGYASSVLRNNREQTVTISRQMRDWIMQQNLADNDTFCLHLKFTSATLIEAGHYYDVEICFPSVGVTDVKAADNSGRLGETVTLPVLYDTTYDSVKVLVKNKVATYAA